MTQRVLLLGVKSAVLDDVRRELQEADFEFQAGPDADDLRSVLSHGDVDQVIIGGGLDLATRAEMVQAVFQLSGYVPELSPQEILRARHGDPR